jgi:glutathione S-transferase
MAARLPADATRTKEINMPALKLYQWKSSPNSRRIRMFLAEKAVDIPFEPVNLGEGEQRSDWYVAINPRGVVPTLVLEDGTAIGEVPAIMRYLEETFPEPALFGSTAKDRALVTMWERRMELEGFAAVMEAVRNAVPALKGRALAGPHGYEQIPELAERSKERVKDFYADLNSRLSRVSFVAGDTFSAADITALVTVDFATTALKLPVPDETNAVRRWYESVTMRPSATA